MTRPVGTDVAWYIQTAGVRPEHDYRWLPVEPGDNEATASSVLYGTLAGQELAELVSERTASIVLGRRADGGYVFYANRLGVPGAPARGDYQNRVITAGLLGVAAPGADPGPLLVVAAAALTGELAEWLPVRWTDGVAFIDRNTGHWPPPPRRAGRGVGATAMAASKAVRPDAAPSVAETLAELNGRDLTDVRPDRILVLSTDVFDLDALNRMRPWRVVTPELKEQVTLLRDRKSVARFRIPAIVILGMVAVVWVVVRWQRRH